MNELLAFCFDDEYEADKVRTELLKMRRDHLIDLEDAIVATRNQEGKIKLRLIHHFSTTGVVGGGMGSILGIVVGSILLTPIFEYVVNDAGTVISEDVLAEIGISRDFIKGLASTMKPGSSALFVLVLKADPDKVLEELKRFKGKVLQTSLPKDEAAIKAALASVK